MQKNIAQEEVINNIYGQTIVIACPGSGKTTTLLRRINNMVENEGIEPSEILMITFTKAAAKEMSTRYVEKFGSNPGITFCTIHALCFALIRRFGEYEYENILIDAQEIVFDIIKNKNEINDKSQFANDVLTDISVVKNNNISLNTFIPKCSEDRDLFISIFKEYEKVKREREKIDFDDILLKAYDMLKNNKDILDWIRDRYGYIHVDEYQDTNFLQRDIVYMIAGELGNLTVVGDDDQSIYAFRGARPEIMLQFKEHYPDAKEIFMSTNYRSNKKILEHASHLINNNKVRFKKDIIAASNDDGVVKYQCYENKKMEMLRVATEIKKLINKGVNPNDIAVLYRTNSQSSSIADVLMELNIPFYSNETIESKYSHWMFQDIMSYYKMATKCGNQSDFIRTVTHPNRFITGVNITQCGFNKDKIKKASYNPCIEEWKNKRMEKNIDNYFGFIDYISILTPEKMLEALYGMGGYEDYLYEYSEYRNKGEGDLLNIWNSYESDITRKNIKTFEEWEKYSRVYNMMLQEKQKNPEGVCLSTMHKSKGLEWKYVFIIDCVNGVTPFSKAETNVEMEEERRLFYVAMTRAKEELYLCGYKKIKGRDVKESPYIKECHIR